ncbi:hypothetical protein B0I37DRAFT_404448 [Chaetomium sp. MPI-CAGE-AT-0009]|nr:hypothetical protein B0I37DRAFT_404448 [Chaetomium sp. MPI-CAGE-AT-0009]
MYRGLGYNRGARRGGRGGSRGGRGGRNSNRGGSRNVYHGDDVRSSTSFANHSNFPTSNGPRRSKAALMGGCILPKHIFGYFNPSADYDRTLMSTINSGEEKPDGVSFAMVHVQSQPRWMDENIIYVKSNLHLLPEYQEKKSLLLEGHKEAGQEELMGRITAELTQSIKFDRYGIEDGPDVEIFDLEGQIASLVLPGDFREHRHPQYQIPPTSEDPIAVFAGYKCGSNASGFKFVAWFLIEEIELFAANSVALARKMHDKKWTADIGHEWAAVKLMRVEKGEPEWRPVPDIRRRPAPIQASGENLKNTPETLQKNAEGVTENSAANGGEITGPQDKDKGSIRDEDGVEGVQMGEPLDKVQEHESEKHEGGSSGPVDETVADVGEGKGRCADDVRGVVENETMMEGEAKTEALEVKVHNKAAKEGSIEELKLGNEITDKVIHGTDKDTAKGMGHHGEGSVPIQNKNEEILMEDGVKQAEAVKVEVEDTKIALLREVVRGLIIMDEINESVLKTDGGEEAKEKEQEA